MILFKRPTGWSDLIIYRLNLSLSRVLQPLGQCLGFITANPAPPLPPVISVHPGGFRDFSS